MITIGIELNHVVRDINKQIVKYYAKEFDPSIDIEEVDKSDDVLSTTCKFESKHARNNFITHMRFLGVLALWKRIYPLR